MNGSATFFPFNKKREDRNKVTESNETLPMRSVLITALNLFLCSLLIPLALAGSETAAYALSLAACLTSTIVMFTSSKKTSHAVFYTIGMVIFLGMSILPLVPALVLGTVVAIGSGAALISSAKGWQKVIVPVLAILSVIASAIICGDILIATISLAVFIPTLALGISSRNKASFSTSAIAGAAAMIFTVLVAIGALIFAMFGSLTVDTLLQAVDTVAADLISSTEISMKELLGLEVNEAMRNMIVYVVDYYINVSIGLLIAACLVVSYFALKIEQNSLEAHGIDRLIDEHTTTLSVGIIPALLFVAALVMSFSLDAFNNASIVAIVADNICIILFPALLVMTSRAIRELPRKLGFIGLLLSGIIVLLIMVALYAFPMAIALVGAIFVIFEHIDSWAKEHYSKGENQ